MYETPYGGVALLRYENAADLPGDNSGLGHFSTVTNSANLLPRGDAAWIVTMAGNEGGGCFPVSPDDPSVCLHETDSLGNDVIVQKERERWILQIRYVDPSTGYDKVILQGEPLEWVRHTSGGIACFTFASYYCNFTGSSYSYLEGNWRATLNPGCALALGPGYYAAAYYQYSRYRITDTLPPGVTDAYVPPTTLATPTSDPVPGKRIFYQTFAVAPKADALRIGWAGPIRPEVEPQVLGGANATGGTAHASIAPGTEAITVTAAECNGPISGVTFTLHPVAKAGSGGHIHDQAGAVRQPPDGAFTDLTSDITATTDAKGQWQHQVTAGRFGGVTEVVAKTNNIKIGTSPLPFVSRTALLGTMFNLSAYTPTGLAADYVLLVGGSNVCPGPTCLNHKDSNHYAQPELKSFVDAMAWFYNNSAKVSEPNKGRIGVNDMSLPFGGRFDIGGAWCCSHDFHRFGVDVDINHSVYDAAGNYVAPLDEDVMKSIVKYILNGQPVQEQNIHYRLPAFTIDAIVNRINAGGF